MPQEPMITTETAYRKALERLSLMRASLPAALADEPPHVESRARALWEKLVARIESDIAYLEEEIALYAQYRTQFRRRHTLVYLRDEWPGLWFLIATAFLLLVANFSLFAGAAAYAAVNAMLCGAVIIVYDLVTSGKYWSPLGAILPVILIGAGAFRLMHM